MKQFVSIVAMVFAVLVIGGCGASSGDPATTQSQPAQEANPAGAIEKIYETIEMRGLVDAQDEDVTDRFQMNLENIESYNIRYSLGRFGVADTFITNRQRARKAMCGTTWRRSKTPVSKNLRSMIFWAPMKSPRMRRSTPGAITSSW